MKYIWSIFFVLVPASLTIAHEGKSHSKKPAPKVEKVEVVAADSLKKINEAYIKDIKPIFKQKCFDCHSDQTNYPWYHSIPGVGYMMDKDIEEGREHMDYSNDFPFGGHGEGPVDDLEALKKTVEEDTMPIWQYKLMHRDSGLTKEEQETILQWIEKSLLLLQKSNNTRD